MYIFISIIRIYCAVLKILNFRCDVGKRHWIFRNFLQIAVFVGPIIAVLFSIFGFCIRYFDTPQAFRWMFHISYFRASFHSLIYTIYGYDRMDLLCDEFYCHYKKPSKFLKEMEINDVNVINNLILVLGIGVLMHLLTASALWCKLNRRWIKYDPIKYNTVFVVLRAVALRNDIKVLRCFHGKRKYK